MQKCFNNAKWIVFCKIVAIPLTPPVSMPVGEINVFTDIAKINADNIIPSIEIIVSNFLFCNEIGLIDKLLIYDYIYYKLFKKLYNIFEC